MLLSVRLLRYELQSSCSDPTYLRYGPGSTSAYCGTGCQPHYGSCDSSSAPISKTGCVYEIGGVGSFTQLASYTFTGTDLPNGLVRNSYTVDDVGSPYTHTFQTQNAYVSDGYLNLKVPGGQTTSPISSAEVQTSITDIMYASVRTTAIFGTSAGTCNGNFFYKTDTNEIDLEFLTDPTSQSLSGGPEQLLYTNHGATNTFDTSPSPGDAKTNAHEYRVDWVPGQTTFYLDGALQKTFTTNVPTQAGEWIWNNWSNGDKGYTVGPPATDNVFRISRIVMYYNQTSSKGTCQSRNLGLRRKKVDEISGDISGRRMY